MTASALLHGATIVVLIATVALVATRPRGLSEGIAALGGAGAVLLLGTATPADVERGIAETAEVLIFLVAMMVVATVAHEAGCFDWAALQAVRLSRHDGRFLFVNLYFLGALVTVFLSLDVTAIMIAPIVCAVSRRARLAPLPYVLACAYVANTASLFFPVSNLTNMLAYSILKVPFWTFARLMTAPNLAAMAVNLVVFFLLFRTQIPARFELPPPTKPPRPNPTRTVVAAIGLGAVVVGLLVVGALGWPLYLPALAGAVVLGAVSLARQDVSPAHLARGVAWPLPPFVVGMYTIVVAANRSGLTGLWGSLYTPSSGSWSLSGLLAIAFGTALGSNLVNNLPMALVGITNLANAGRSADPAMVFASLIGTNVGPNVTVFGSLATMLVLHAARQYGLRLRSTTYLIVGLLTTPFMLLAATVTLWLLVR